MAYKNALFGRISDAHQFEQGFGEGDDFVLGFGIGGLEDGIGEGGAGEADAVGDGHGQDIDLVLVEELADFAGEGGAAFGHVEHHGGFEGGVVLLGLVDDAQGGAGGHGIEEAGSGGDDDQVTEGEELGQVAAEVGGGVDDDELGWAVEQLFGVVGKGFDVDAVAFHLADGFEAALGVDVDEAGG